MEDDDSDDEDHLISDLESKMGLGGGEATAAGKKEEDRVLDSLLDDLATS